MKLICKSTKANFAFASLFKNYSLECILHKNVILRPSRFGVYQGACKVPVDQILISFKFYTLYVIKITYHFNKV